MSLPPEDRKIDLSSFPRGAIGIRGVPVSRNTRLPSIRTPRDLTLGAQPKRTFLPNIPVRREKRTHDKDHGNASSEINSKKDNKSVAPRTPDRGRGRGRGRGQIVQTEGSVFGEGIAASTSTGRGKQRESGQRSSFPSGKGSAIKREIKAEISMSDITKDLDNLMRDDFIDDGDDEEKICSKPIMFPLQADKQGKKKNIKTENTDRKDSFNNQDFAKELGFDVKKIAKFIKKEKGDEEEVKQAAADLPKNGIPEFLTEKPELLLLRFPETVALKLPDFQQKGQTSMESTPPSDRKNTSASLSSLPAGPIGRLQILKSGRARLKIGDVYYYLDSISTLKSKHEVASIDVDSDSGDIAILGNVNKSLSFVPDI